MHERPKSDRQAGDRAGRLSRRELLQRSSAAAAAIATGISVGGLPAQAGAADAPAGNARDSLPYNILLIVVDQERHFDAWPFPVPGRERLARMGTRFTNHQIASNVCSPSRSVIYTGQHIQRTGVFDNVTAPWQPSMATDVPTIGHMLRRAGYHTAYKGKWHLSVELDRGGHDKLPLQILPDFLEPYGFSDYYGIGDAIGSARGGYLNDEVVASTAVRWLRRTGKPLAARGQPWCLAVNFINPHDVMYLDTDRPGEVVQMANAPVMRMLGPPDAELYRATWEVPLPESRSQSFDDPGRPNAHRDYQDARSVLLGSWPGVDWRWRALQDYYFNCIRDSDRHVERLLDELANQGLLERTVIVFTSDHGELGGAHQMHGKGSCAYREQNHVPLIVVHPAHAGGGNCAALTSHLDVVPTLLGLARAPVPSGSALKGRDLSPLIARPQSAKLDAVREGTLFNFNMLTYLDGAFLRALKEVRDAKRLKKAAKAIAAIRRVAPALGKRGAIRSWFDGRYRFSRYFSPRQHHVPQTLEQLATNNDLELFDLHNDPHELRNLAQDLSAHGGLVLELNARLNAIVQVEVGEDSGRFLPLSKLKDWNLDVVDI